MVAKMPVQESNRYRNKRVSIVAATDRNFRKRVSVQLESIHLDSQKKRSSIADLKAEHLKKRASIYIDPDVDPDFYEEVKAQHLKKRPSIYVEPDAELFSELSFDNMRRRPSMYIDPDSDLLKKRPSLYSNQDSDIMSVKSLDNLKKRKSIYIDPEYDYFAELQYLQNRNKGCNCFSDCKLPKLTSGKKQNLKNFSEVETLIKQGKKREAKIVLRENAWPSNSTIRSQLWPLLCNQHQIGKSMLEGFYWDMVNQVFGTTELPEKSIMLPPFVDSTHCLPYHLTRKGRAVADRVVSVLGFACPDITYSPTLYPIASMLLHFMSEEECYHSMASLMAAKEKVFITQTKLLYEVTWKTVMQIAKKHTKNAVMYLTRLCPGQKSERIFMDWCWWIMAGLPFPHLVRVMDCFFHEGIKVFYRVALAILILFHKHSSSTNSEWDAESIKNDIDNAIPKFCKNIPVSPTKLLRTAFNIRALSSTYISRVFIKTEMLLKSKSVLSGSKQLTKSRSSEYLPISQSQINIQMMSNTLTIRELFTLWSWLPVRITMYQPVLLYTTEEHGCSLTTFYVRVEQHEPTLLMIKTSNNEVFGAYCSTRWYERNLKDDRGNRQAYFGTGETFLFSLFPERIKYPWVGIENGEGLGHSSELFMAADSKMITIGGGEGQAIWMDENIRFGKTDSCKTFNNPPLCTSGDFEIRVLEVYGFVGV